MVHLIIIFIILYIRNYINEQIVILPQTFGEIYYILYYDHVFSEWHLLFYLASKSYSNKKNIQFTYLSTRSIVAKPHFRLHSKIKKKLNLYYLRMLCSWKPFSAGGSTIFLQTKIQTILDVVIVTIYYIIIGKLFLLFKSIYKPQNFSQSLAALVYCIVSYRSYLSLTFR